MGVVSLTCTEPTSLESRRGRTIDGRPAIPSPKPTSTRPRTVPVVTQQFCRGPPSPTGLRSLSQVGTTSTPFGPCIKGWTPRTRRVPFRAPSEIPRQTAPSPHTVAPVAARPPLTPRRRRPSSESPRTRKPEGSLSLPVRRGSHVRPTVAPPGGRVRTLIPSSPDKEDPRKGPKSEKKERQEKKGRNLENKHKHYFVLSWCKGKGSPYQSR